MTEHAQGTTLGLALILILFIGLAVWLVVRQIIEEDIKDSTQRSIDEFTEDMYLKRKAPAPTLISAGALAWLEQKLRLDDKE